MNSKKFNKLIESTNQAIEHAEGKRELRTTKLPKKPVEMQPEDVRQLREEMNVSQAVLAAALNVSTGTIQSWEQGLKKPSGAALKLLSIAKKNPNILFK